ncbi:MAG: class I SAM-dependent methyltransferase, partial [Thermomicrobiales bacterium]|nr:class I SAM-dependent methyltransferase [Thermomicrobiales bacterium]
TLVHSDMAEADRAPGGPFGLALIPLNGLVHAATPAAQRAVLESARRALDPRGQLVIDVFNPTPDALRAFDQSAVHEGRWRLPNGTVVDKFGARTLHAATQTIATDLWYDLTDAGGALHRIATSYTMRYLHMAELALMLELAGFVEWEVYGGYDLEPYEDNSERLLVTAEVTRSR